MRRTLKIAAAVVGALLLAGIALPFFIDANRFRPELEARLGQALGRAVKVGNLKLSVFSGGVTADNLSIADDPAFSQTPFAQAQSAHVGVDLPALVFSRRLTVRSLTIGQPEIHFLQSPSGEWNFSTLGTKSARTAAASAAPAPASASNLGLSVELVKISNGRFTVGRTQGHWKPLVLEKVNAEVRDFAPASSFPFSVSMTVAGGGAIKLDGKARPLDENDIAVTPATVTLQVDKLDLAGSGLNELAPELAGLVSFSGGGQNSASGIELNGKLKIDKLKLSPKGSPATRGLELDFHIAHDLKKRSGRVHQGDIHFGSAITRLTGTYVPEGDTFAIEMSLDGPRMDVQELEGLLPALGVVLPGGTSLRGGTAGVKATITGPVDHLLITGSITMNNTRLVGFDLSHRMSEIEKLAGIKAGPDTEVQELSGDVRVAQEGISAGNLKLVLPAIGDVTGAGAVNPDTTLNFKMQASVHSGGIARIMSNEPVPFTVDGTCNDPHFHADVAAVMKDSVKGVGRAAGGLLKDLLGERKKKSSR